MENVWSGWKPNQNGKQFRELRNEKGILVCRQVENENGACFNPKGQKIAPHILQSLLPAKPLVPRSVPEDLPQAAGISGGAKTGTLSEFQPPGTDANSRSLGYIATSSKVKLEVITEQPESSRSVALRRVSHHDDEDVRASSEARAPPSTVSEHRSRPESHNTNFSYQVKDFKEEHGDFFQVGRVFRVPWFEPMGTAARTPPNSKKADDGIYKTVRPVVVVKRFAAHCICLPVYSHGGQGVAKKGLKPREVKNHAIIYTMADNKSKVPDLLEDEKKIGIELREPIPVESAGSSSFHEASRVRFDKPVSINFNVKVRNLGNVESSHLKHLVNDWLQAMTERA